MSQHHDAHDDHGGGHHGGTTPSEWVLTHMAGIILPIGRMFEKSAERIMFSLVNNFFRRVAIVYFVLFTPILFLEFLVRYFG